MKNLLYISMLGESSCYNVDDFKDLCLSGLERDWIVDWFRPLATEYGFSLSGIDICRGDELPPPSDIDTVIVGGTGHDVRDTFAWLTKLTLWLKDYRSFKRPLLGICGGHQLVSIIFDDGVMAARSEGRLAGTYTVARAEEAQQHPLFENMPQNPKFHFGNSFYVLPEASSPQKILASIDGNPAIAIDHGQHWYSCQFHPESQKKTWECYFDGDDGVDMERFSEDHDGQILFENFLKISSEFLEEMVGVK
jgi:GMP synthase (glutamine-hydrolysing)